MTSIMHILRGYYCKKCKNTYADKSDYDMHYCMYRD